MFLRSARGDTLTVLFVFYFNVGGNIKGDTGVGEYQGSGGGGGGFCLLCRNVSVHTECFLCPTGITGESYFPSYKTVTRQGTKVHENNTEKHFKNTKNCFYLKGNQT
jgi:hypothetical protein